MHECKFCGGDIGKRGMYGNREADYCSEECRHHYHNMNRKIERKIKIVRGIKNDLDRMLQDTENCEQKRTIETLIHNLRFIDD
jgi:hypothetical protein